MNEAEQDELAERERVADDLASLIASGIMCVFVMDTLQFVFFSIWHWHIGTYYTVEFLLYIFGAPACLNTEDMFFGISLNCTQGVTR